MLFPIRPADALLRDLLARSRGLPLSSPDLGATSGAPPTGYARDHHRVRLGEGPRAFDRACEEFRGRAMLDLGWIGPWPPNAPIEEGAVVVHGFGVWAAFTCRVIRVWEDRGPVESLRFTYGTLPGHLLAGEERFEIGWDHRRAADAGPPAVPRGRAGRPGGDGDGGHPRGAAPDPARHPAGPAHAGPGPAGAVGAAILPPMGLARLYALGAYRHAVWIDIAGMFRYQGADDALGFALPSLLAWHVAPRPGRGIAR